MKNSGHTRTTHAITNRTYSKYTVYKLHIIHA